MSDNDKFLIELLQEMRDDIKEIRLDSKDMKEDIHAIKITDVIQNKQLAEHIKRTELAEASLLELRQFIDEALVRLEPKPFDYKKFISWLIGLGIPIGGFLVALNKAGII
jgi:hypothetical protein